MSRTLRDTYIQYRKNPDNDTHSLAHFCTMYGFSLSDVKEVVSTDKHLEHDILVARRDAYASRMQKIDNALFKSAESGDTRAADLLYRRFDGWNPKIIEETNNFYNFTDIIKRAAKKRQPTRSIIKREISDGEA